jgi:ribosome biogenesis GTPase
MMRRGGRLDGPAGGPQAGAVSLEDIGWNDGWADAARAAAGDAVPARVIIEHRGAYEVTDGERVMWAELPGRAYFDARDKRELPAVGDWVMLDGVESGGAAVIRTVLPRRSLIVRRAAGEKTAPQPIAANVDVGFVVTSANADMNPRRLERYLVTLAEGGVRPVIVLSKGDLVADTAPIVADIATIAPGVEVAVTSAVDGRVDVLRAALAGGTGVLIGSSGVGKSTLLNLLLGREAMATQAIRTHDDRGKHTTTRRELFAVPGGGVLIDTPGMRELQIWDAEAGLEHAFGDIELLAGSCRFRDCGHAGEPGCAVVDAVTRGDVARGRLESYHRLKREDEFLRLRHDEHARMERARQAKQTGRAIKLMYKLKGKPG